MNLGLMESKMVDMNIALNDMLFILKMADSNRMEYVSEKSLKMNRETFNELSSELDNSYSKKEPLIYSFISEGKYKSKIVTSDEEYDKLYLSQRELLDSMIKNCDEMFIKLEDYRKIEEETDSIMKELNDKVYGQSDKNTNLHEMIYNEINDVFLDTHSFINAHDDYAEYDFNEIVNWTLESINRLEIIKKELENDYNNGKQIECARYYNGKYIIEKLDNNEENFNTQAKFLERMIESCNSLKNKVSIQKMNKQFSEKKYVVFRVGGKVNIVSNDLTMDEIKKIDSPILKEALKFGLEIETFNYPLGSINNINGAIIKIDENGIISLEGNIEEADFYNQDSFVTESNINNEDKEINASETVEGLLSAVSSNNVDEVIGIFRKATPEIIWKEVNSRLDNGSMTEEEFISLVNYLTDNYDKEDKNRIIRDRVFQNDEYQKIIIKHPLEKEENVSDKEIVKVNDMSSTAIIPSGKKIKRKQNISLIDRFKNLKIWKKAAIAASVIALSLVNGLGLYHIPIKTDVTNEETISAEGNINLGNGVLESKDVEVAKIENQIGESTENNSEDVHTNDNKISEIEKVQEIQLNENKPIETEKKQEIQENNNEIDINPQLYVDYNAIGEGHEIYNDAVSSISGENGVTANEHFQNTPMDAYNTKTGSFMNLTEQQLNNPNVLQELSQDPNNAILFGNVNDGGDGFISAQTVANEVVKGGKSL